MGNNVDSHFQNHHHKHTFHFYSLTIISNLLLLYTHRRELECILEWKNNSVRLYKQQHKDKYFSHRLHSNNFTRIYNLLNFYIGLCLAHTFYYDIYNQVCISFDRHYFSSRIFHHHKLFFWGILNLFCIQVGGKERELISSYKNYRSILDLMDNLDWISKILKPHILH